MREEYSLSQSLYVMIKEIEQVPRLPFRAHVRMFMHEHGHDVDEGDSRPPILIHMTAGEAIADITIGMGE